jgi:hypothetical protein
MIPRFPFRRDNFVADDYLLFFFPSAFNFDFFHTTISLTLIDCNYHFSLHVGFYADTKKPAKKSFRVLAGVNYKPKRLCAT